MNQPQYRVVRSAFRGEVTPNTTEMQAYESLLIGLSASFIKIACDYATELALIIVSVGTWVSLSLVSPILATVVTSVLITACAVWPPSRHFIVTSLKHSQTKRRFDSAARFAGLATHNDQVPKTLSINDIPAGSQLRVRIPSGSAFSYLEEAAERMATCLDAREIRIEPDRTSARFANVTIIWRDPFGDAREIAWPNMHKPDLSVWEPVPVGLDEFGQAVTVSLPERNLLLGGEPGAGKSVALSQLVATAALDPHCVLTLLDGKRVELACWSRCAKATVGPSLDEAIDVLQSLRTEMDGRYERLLADGKRKVEPKSGMPLHVVVCDELAFYLTMGDRKQTQEFGTLMRDLVARGRAAGVILLAATQKPSHDIIPTSLRDLFAFRWALRCTTPQSSDTILGQGWASEGFSAKGIDSAQRGVGLLLHEGGEPIRLKSFCLTDDDLVDLAARGHALRKERRSLRVA